MGIVPIDIQTQGNWEQLFRGNYSKGLRTFNSILELPDLAQTMIADRQALACIYTNVDFKNATGLLAKEIGNSKFCEEAFNNFCGVRGVPIKATFVLTCADTNARNALFADKALLNIVTGTPTLIAVLRRYMPAFTLANIKTSIKEGYYALWPLGSSVDIALSSFTMYGSTNFPATTTTFELVGIDEDTYDVDSRAPLTLFMKNLHANNAFVQNASNSNEFSNSAFFQSSVTMFNALPQEWRNIASTKTHFSIAANGSATTAVRYNLHCFGLKEGRIFGKRSYSVPAEFDVTPQYSGFATGACSPIKKYNNGTGSPAYWWEPSPCQGNSNAFCRVTSDGTPNNNGAADSNGLCFGFCLKREV